MTSFFQQHGSTLHSSKIAIKKNLPKQKTSVISGLHSHWLKYTRRNLVLFQVPFWFSVGLPAKKFPLGSFSGLHGYCCNHQGNEICLFYGFVVTGPCGGGWWYRKLIDLRARNLGFSPGLAII